MRIIPKIRENLISRLFHSAKVSGPCFCSWSVEHECGFMKEVDLKAQQNSEEVQQIEIVSVEDKVIENVENVTVKDKTVKDKPVKDKVVKDKPVKDETVEDKPVEDETVVNEIVEDETVEETDVESVENTEEVADNEEPEYDEKASAKRLETLEEKRSIVDNDADMHRKQRDEYHALSKEWKAKRDSLNAQVREFVTDAGKCRDQRDQFNALVRESKAQRDEWNVKVSELKVRMAELRPERPEDKDKPGQSLDEMKKNLRRMEIDQQTKPMKKDAEDKLVKEISTLAKSIHERQCEVESSLEQNSEFRGIHTEFKESKAKAETYHSEMTLHAEQAQSEHEKMIALYDQADRIRKEADAAQAKQVEYKHLGDDEHKKHIELVGSIHESDKEASVIRNRKSNVRKKKVEAENKKEAKDIFERFKNGEKLSTEDLMALQRSGYL